MVDAAASPKKTTYEYRLRDGTCFDGQIVRVSDSELDVNHAPPIFPAPDIERQIPRSELVSVGRLPGALYYSERSSWADIRSIPVFARTRLKIVTKRGETLIAHGAPSYIAAKSKPIVHGDTIDVEEGGTVKTIHKRDIERVYLVVQKPYTDDQAYALGELGPLLVFDPYAYQYWWHLEKYLEVLLYDARKPEDDRVILCTKL